MALTPGTRIGGYEITAQIGEDGMGQVYRAIDAKLKRQVAIKILPPALAVDADRRARFQREAEVLASLNHPNIAGIYGLEDGGDMTALVMELVEGEDLSQRVARGAIPPDEALAIAMQIGEALNAANEHGIIHRDLKPGNIRVRPDGAVKVLDFGLAKAVEPVGRASTVSQSLTITTPPITTGAGVILGSAAYMAPEHAKGKPVDKRADIWAFGAVLFEMLAGRRAFDGVDVGDTLAAVLRADPDWNALPAEVGFPIRTLLRGCLEKDPRQRIADISTVLFVLRHQALDTAAEGTANARHSLRGGLRGRALVTAIGLLLGIAVGGAGMWWWAGPVPLSIKRTPIATFGSTALQVSHHDIAITPDGSRIVYQGNGQLLVRSSDRVAPTLLSGLGEPAGIFTSADGQWVGFFDGFKLLKKVAITGGPPTEIGPSQGIPAGATWGRDDTIIFATNAPATGLLKVNAATGGEPTVVTTPNRERGEADHLWPEFLPGGAAILFTVTSITGGIDTAKIAVLHLRTLTWKELIRGGSHAHYLPSGHLVYSVAGTLRAVAFDLARPESVGTSVPVLDGVPMNALGGADVAVAANGSLVYVPGEAMSENRRTIEVVDRKGTRSTLPNLPPDAYRSLRVSHDKTRLALATDFDVFIYDFAGARLSKLTTYPASNRTPLWTRDDQRIIFTSTRAGYLGLFSRLADGTGNDELVLSRGKNLLDLQATGWSPDGKLLFCEVSQSVQCVIGQATLEHPVDAQVLLKDDSCNIAAAVSSKGHGIAYVSNRAGRFEVVVARYPEISNRKPIATAGELPLWSRDSSELFFSCVDRRQMLAVKVQIGTTIFAGPPQKLFDMALPPLRGGDRLYDTDSDGQFFVITSGQEEPGAGTATRLVLQENWLQELKRLVPVN